MLQKIFVILALLILEGGLSSCFMSKERKLKSPCVSMNGKPCIRNPIIG